MGVKEYFIEIGREEGREEEKRLFVKNLLADGHYTSSMIADLVGVSEAYVRKIKRTLKS